MTDQRYLSSVIARRSTLTTGPWSSTPLWLMNLNSSTYSDHCILQIKPILVDYLVFVNLHRYPQMLEVSREDNTANYRIVLDFLYCVLRVYTHCMCAQVSNVLY
jgi:hypothetical protein